MNDSLVVLMSTNENLSIDSIFLPLPAEEAPLLHCDIVGPLTCQGQTQAKVQNIKSRENAVGHAV